MLVLNKYVLVTSGLSAIFLPPCPSDANKMINFVKCRCCSIYEAPPTAELEPLAEGKVAQLDEVCKYIVEYL